RTVYFVRAAGGDRDELRKLRDLVILRRVLVKQAGLEDRRTARQLVFIGQHVVVAEDAELTVRLDERAERPGHHVARFRSCDLISDRTAGVGWTMPRLFGMHGCERAKCTGLDHVGGDFSDPS